MQTAGNGHTQQWTLHLLALHTRGFSKFAGNKGAKRIGDIRHGQDVGICDLSRFEHFDPSNVQVRFVRRRCKTFFV
jgi:hypothetical protein